MVGNYDGHDRTLQVFNADASDELRLLEHLEPYLPLLEQAAGGPLVVILLSAKQSLRHADYVRPFKSELSVRRISPKVDAAARNHHFQRDVGKVVVQ